MATVSKWTPFGVALNVTATSGTVTRTSATKFTVVINASWASYYSGNKTNYGMDASSGGATKTINTFGNKAGSGSGSFTGTYSISGNGAQTKSITVTFRNYNNDNGNSASKNVTLSVSVPAWTSYTVSYNANGGSGAPGNQTKWKDQALTLSTTKPTRTGHTFQGWGTSASDTSVDYAAGATVAAGTNKSLALYAIWKANTCTVSYNANGGSGAPASQTKTYGFILTLSSTRPTRTNYTFKGWALSKNATSADYQPGGQYGNDVAVTLYAVWELSYVKPSIDGLNVYRCLSNGTYEETGTYFKIEFVWSCDQTIGTNYIQSANYTIDGGSAIAISVNTSTTSGTVSIVAGGNISIETTHTIKVTVYDTAGSSGNNYTTETTTLPATKFPIDIMRGGQGIAFGKPASKYDVADFAYEVYMKGANVDGDGTTSYQYVAHNPATNLNTGFYAGRTDTGTAIWMGIGGGGANHGIYSMVCGGWIIFNTGNDTYIRAKNGSSVIIDENDLYISYAKSIKTRYLGDNYSSIISVASNQLSTYIGPSDIKQNTVTYLRGQTVRIYNHSGGAVYLGASGSTAVTSDRNLKKDVFDLDDKYIDFFNKLTPVTYKYNDHDIVGHRDHVGFIAQDVEQALLDSGLTTEQFAGICIETDVTIDKDYDTSTPHVDDYIPDPIVDDDAVIDDNVENSDIENTIKTETSNANEKTETVEPRSSSVHYDKLYSLRYEEFIALNTHMIQRTNKIIEEQQKTIDIQQTKINELEQKLIRLERMMLEV